MPCARAEDALPSAAADMVSAALIQKAAGGGARRPAEPGRALQRTPHVSAGDVDAPAPAASCSGVSSCSVLSSHDPQKSCSYYF